MDAILNYYKPRFNKHTFYNFYKAVKTDVYDEIGRVFTKETWKKLIEIFKTKPKEIEPYWQTFLDCMKDLYSVDKSHFDTMIRYLFARKESMKVDTLDLLLELLEWNSDTKKTLSYFNPKDAEIDFTYMDEYYNNISQETLKKALNYLAKHHNNEVHPVAKKALKNAILNKNYSKAYAIIALIIYDVTGKIIYKTLDGKMNWSNDVAEVIRKGV